jgi:large subunit ribosomal protein L2
MPIRKYKPTTPGRRQMTGLTYEEITTKVPHKALITKKKSAAGRNNTGSIMVRHQGGGHKKRLRTVDFQFSDKLNVPAKVETIEYDPNRSGFIALVCYRDGERRYILAHSTMKVGDMVITAESAKPVPGNRMRVGNIPVGINVYNVELIVGQGS